MSEEEGEAQEAPEEEEEAADEEPAADEAAEEELAGQEDEEEQGEDEQPAQPAADLEPSPSPVQEDEEDSALEEGIEVQEHLKDAVEGSLRLKRMLSEDDDLDPSKKGNKKRKIENPEHTMKVRALQMKWGLANDHVVKYVLDNMDLSELKEMAATSWAPDPFNSWKSASELLAKHVGELRERKMVGSQKVDVITAFKKKWGLDMNQEKALRALAHKELRHVLTYYTGETSLDEMITEASAAEPDENSAVSALPEAPGSATMGRFSRLELIDPLADAAVFGDANLTFSLKLAKHRKALGHVGRVVATTFEEVETLRERYKEIDESIKKLEDHFAEVYHGVDCTRIAIDPRFEGMEGSLGAVYYNFPHSGAIQGFFDGHPVVNWRHENLMRLFFRALRSFVKPGGFVKVSSNASAVGVRYSYIVGSAVENEFQHIETMPFLEWHLHRYGRSYGDKRDVYKRPDAANNQSYNAQRAEADMVYCFKYVPTGQTLEKQRIRMPPSFKVLCSVTDGPFQHLQEQQKKNLAKQLHKRFVTEVSGTHVG